MLAPEWLDEQRDFMIEQFCELGRNAAAYPAYAGLPDEQLREIMSREWLGMYSFLIHEGEGLEQATQQHRRHSQAVTRDFPVQEQMDFLEARLHLVQDRLAQDPRTRSFRDSLQRLLNMCASYYRVAIQRLALENLRGSSTAEDS